MTESKYLNPKTFEEFLEQCEYKRKLLDEVGALNAERARLRSVQHNVGTSSKASKDIDRKLVELADESHAIMDEWRLVKQIDVISSRYKPHAIAGNGQPADMPIFDKLLDAVRHRNGFVRVMLISGADESPCYKNTVGRELRYTGQKYKDIYQK